MHVPRLGRKEQRREDLLDDRADRRKRQSGAASTQAFVLNVRVRDSCAPQKLKPRLFQAGSDDAGRRDEC